MKPLVIAHRGARSLAPENTLAAARTAHALGADMWELDVHLSADGELIVFHDDTLTRTTNARAVFPQRMPWWVSDFTLAEIKHLDTGRVFLRSDPFGQIAAGHVSPAAQAALQTEPVPTLREALQLTIDLDWRVNVEIKAQPPQSAVSIPERVTRLIEELRAESRVLVSSFVPDYLQQVAALNPNIPLALLTEGPIAQSLLAKFLLAGAAPPLVHLSGFDPSPLLAQLGSTVFHPYHHTVTPEDVRILGERGIAVNIWTVNNPADMRHWIAAGVNGIITDFPQLLVDMLITPPGE